MKRKNDDGQKGRWKVSHKNTTCLRNYRLPAKDPFRNRSAVPSHVEFYTRFSINITEEKTGATFIFAAPQDFGSSSLSYRGSSLPDIRQRTWPSFEYLDRNVQDNKIYGKKETETENGRNSFRGISTNVKAEKMQTAIATTEYMGTRAIAYAGFDRLHHQHHHHHHHHQRGGFFAQGYQQPTTTVAQPAGGTGYTKHHPGRRVCSRQIPSSVSHHHRGRQIRLVYTKFPNGFSCCPGWTQVTRLSFGCNKPACSTTCLNGGTCQAPGKCTCPKQFTGQQCQFDVDECSTEKPCAQICQNTFGGYECSCRNGYQLQTDRQSCRKNGSDETAFEARDLEGDYKPTTTIRTLMIPRDTENEVGDDRDLNKDYEFILKRLAKLERLIARSKRRDAGATEMSAKINLAVENIGELKRAVENVRLMQQEIYDLRNQLDNLKQESRNTQHVANRVAALESRIRIHCGGSFNGSGRGIC